MSEIVINFEIDDINLEALRAMFLEDAEQVDIKDHQVIVYLVDQEIRRGTFMVAETYHLTAPVDLQAGDEVAVSALGVILAVRRDRQVVYELPGLHDY